MNELRERFIEDYKLTHPKDCPDSLFEQTDQKHGQAGRFRNQRIHEMWVGYELFYKSNFRLHHAGTRVWPEGQYVVGRLDNHRVAFSANPYRHTTREAAVQEAHKLASTHQKQFLVFRCLATVSPDPLHKDQLERKLEELAPAIVNEESFVELFKLAKLVPVEGITITTLSQRGQGTVTITLTRTGCTVLDIWASRVNGETYSKNTFYPMAGYEKDSR